ncbi:DUF916 and DUF3324 domain-containing protein [Listeria ilorinensis]|uniref:DUF916 and DUF3324 domain-containing protein n=1 Tax=Listeria ilorinensis TaxID=2867439 RepID=UPI001EF43A60|nr:DUF916 and DUF3324 domain-containing protein [Listeria ilorinensis]
MSINWNKKTMCFVLTALLLLVIINSRQISVSASEMKFSVEAKIPDNQIDKDKTYFDLLVKPGETQDLIVLLKNDTNEKREIEVAANTAITNDNGIIDYTMANYKRDRTLAYAFKDIVSTDNKVVIPPKSEISHTFKLAIPPEKFKGVILGGLFFKEKLNNSSKKNQINNEFAYVIGVQLTESHEAIEPDLKVNKVSPDQKNYRNVIVANVQNTAPTIIKNMQITGTVYKNDKIICSISNDKVRMAPNSNFNFQIPWNNKFKPGKYKLALEAKTSEKTWNWKKNFEIKSDTAKKYNKKVVGITENQTSSLLYHLAIAILCGIIIVLFAIMFCKRKSKGDQNELS